MCGVTTIYNSGTRYHVGGTNDWWKISEYDTKQHPAGCLYWNNKIFRAIINLLRLHAKNTIRDIACLLVQY